MNKSIVMVCPGNSFFVINIVDTLEKSGFNVIECEADIEEFELCKAESEFVIYYIEENIKENQDFLVYLKDACLEEDKMLYLVGSKEELEMALDVIPVGLVARKFERPLNVGDLVETVKKGVNSDNRKKILVVDDDSFFLRTMKEWLSGKYAVTMVNSGMNAITYLARYTPDLILLDYEMPVASGPKILEMIRTESATSDTPVIFLTGKSDKESVMNVLALKPDGYLLKSMSRSELLAAIEEFFIKRKNIIK